MTIMNRGIRILPIIGITLTLIGYLYLTFQTYNLNERRKVLKNEITELELIKTRMTNEAKVKDTIINLQDKIISQSSDTSTVNKGLELNIENNKTKSNYFVITKKENSSIEKAIFFENEGFNYLIEKDINNAVISFKKSENSYNGFHQVYEIAKYLEKNKDKLSTKDSELWKEVYLTILTDFSWRMPNDIKLKFKDITN